MITDTLRLLVIALSGWGGPQVVIMNKCLMSIMTGVRRENNYTGANMLCVSSQYSLRILFVGISGAGPCRGVGPCRGAASMPRGCEWSPVWRMAWPACSVPGWWPDGGLSEGYWHGGPGVCVGDGQTEAYLKDMGMTVLASAWAMARRRPISRIWTWRGWSWWWCWW